MRQQPGQPPAPYTPTPTTRTTVATPPIGIQTRSLRQPLRKALATASELGADGVEIDLRNELRIADFSQTALRQFRRILEDSRLKVLAVAFPTRHGFDEPEGLERRILATREAMTFGYKIGAPVLIGRAGEMPAAEDEGGTLVESLRLLGAHGEHTGTRFAFASGESPSAQRGLLDRLEEGVVGVALHPAKLIGSGHDPAEAAATLGGSVLHLHAVDAVREASLSGGGASEVQLGRGEADLPAVLARLEERGYRGPITIERRDAASPAAEIGDAVAYLRAL